jgi:hypothetical protein
VGGGREFTALKSTALSIIDSAVACALLAVSCKQAFASFHSCSPLSSTGQSPVAFHGQIEMSIAIIVPRLSDIAAIGNEHRVND